MPPRDSQLNLFEDSLPEEEGASLDAISAFPRGSQGPAPTVRRLWLRNMKGFQELEVEFSDFNVLVGPNNCGKSTVLQAIDLCFRLMQLHVEFRAGVLAAPRAGRRILEIMLPVAAPEDFWFQGVTRTGNERIPVTIGIELAANVRFEFEIRSLWGGLNSRMKKFPEGLPEENVNIILSRRPTLIPYAAGIVTQEEYRAPARLELLSLTGHRNEILRNFVRELSNRNPQLFVQMQRELLRHFGATIGDVAFRVDRDQYISVPYVEGGAKHDIYSVGGGFLQVLQLLTNLYLQAPGIVLLDEPDAHLHSSMQRLVVDLLVSLNKADNVQVVMATHSKEIVNYVDASHILPIGRKEPKARSLERHASVLPILQDMGAIDNVDLATLIGSKRCFFVEGKSDRRIFARFAAKLGSTVFEGESQVVPISTEGVDNPERVVNLEILEKVIGTRLRCLIVRDRDGLPLDLVNEIRLEAEKHQRNVIVLGRTQIENYVLVPNAIVAVVLSEMALRDKASPTSEEIHNEIKLAIDTLKDEAFDNIGIHVQQHHVAYRLKHLDVKATNELAREFLEEQWQTFAGRLAVVEGRKALKTIRSRIQGHWGVSFSDTRVIDAITVEEVPGDIVQIIRILESL
jgi:energy-coupling factor transporter ATP-binding protein EcfA2